MVIHSLDNKKIKKYYSLKMPKGRQKEQLFLVEGKHLCEEALKTNYLVDLLVLEGEELPFSCPFEVTYVNEHILKKLSSLTTPQKVIGICQMQEKNITKGDYILLLDDIKDPGNMGTIIRSSKAFNVNTIILSNDSIDVYNEKVLRSCEGMIFHLNIMYGNLEELIPKLKEENYLILGTDVKEGIDVRSIKANKYALVMGNEGHGVKEEIKALCDKNLYIKMNSKCESLNVGVATSILLYELNKDRYE